MSLYKILGNYSFNAHWGKRRTYICTRCGLLERTVDYGRYVDHPNKKHCGINLIPLSHEQSIAAHLITNEKRVQWMEKEGYILRGNKKKKRWIPVFSDDDIKTAIKQRSSYIKKDQSFVEVKADKLFSIIIDEYLHMHPKQADIMVNFSSRINSVDGIKDALRIGYEKIWIH